MRSGFPRVAAAALVLLGTAHGLAAEQRILGKRLMLRAPHGDEARRSVMLVAREVATDVGAIVGDPAAGGATLMIGLDSGAAGQSFFLEPAGWSATATGFRYRAPAGTAEPVKRVDLRRTRGGTAVLEVVLRGNVGQVPLDVVPPDPGSSAVAVLALAGGDVYCTSLGGAAGGRILTNTAATFRIVDATAEPACPVLCCSFSGSCGFGTGTDAAACASVGGTLGLAGSVCDGATGACQPPPVDAGNCCQFGPLCFGGPSVQQPQCDEVGGAFFTAAVCDPGGTCIVP